MAEQPPPKSSIRFRTFRSGDEAAFHRLNEAWISKYYALEPHDIEVLSDPHTHILEPGGQICMAELADEPIGCCALIVMAPGELELAKMTIAEHARGSGAGRSLLQFAIEEAKRMGAHRLYLESSTKAAAAVYLYEQLGFRYLPPPQQPSPYARANVWMELRF